MLLHCPTCHATVEAGPLPPGATASCPFCRGLFQVPAEVVASAIPLAIPMSVPAAFSGVPVPPEPMPPADAVTSIYQPPQADIDSEPLLPPGVNPLEPPVPLVSELPPVADAWPTPAPVVEATTAFQQPFPPFAPEAPVVALDPIAPAPDFPGIDVRPTPAFQASSHAVAARSTRPASPRKQGKGLGTMLIYGFAVMGAFALIGGGAGALVVYFMRSPGEVAAAPTPRAADVPSKPWEPPVEPEANSTPASSAAPAEPKQPGVAVWQIVGNWRGVGPFKSKPFKSTGSRLRIQWNAMPRDPSNPDNFALYLTDVRGKRLHTPVSIVGAGADTTMVTASPRTYVLEVFTFGTDWEVKVDESE